MKGLKATNRRRVLKIIGASVVGSGVLTGSASAKNRTSKESDYGNGNGIGAFLNEEAVWKENPIWSSGIANRIGEDNVEIDIGAMTSLSISEEEWEEFTGGDPAAPPAPDEGPFSFAPRAVKVSPGTTVNWVWAGNTFLGFRWPHDVVSFDRVGGDPLFQSGEKPEWGATTSHEFDDTGTYLYYCTPHGGPEPYHGHYNLAGMRGAVIVSGR